MKVQCPKCNATYRISDDRVPAGGGTIKVRCKTCGNVMDIQTAGTGQAAVSEERWFVAVGNDKRGPMDRARVIAMIRSGEIGMETYVWRKGFKEWQRLGDVAELATGGSGTRGAWAASRTPATAPSAEGPRPVSDSDIEPTVMEPLPAAALEGRESPADAVEESGPRPTGPADDTSPRPGPDSGAFPSPTTEASGPSAPEEDSETRMIWQRRETSVLFSLDDYKTRKKTRSVKSVTVSAPLVQVQPITPDREEASVPRGTERVKVISLEEAEVKRVAEALKQRQRRRVLFRYGAIAVAGGVVVAVAAYMVTTRIGHEEPMPEQGQAGKAPAPASAPAVAPRTPPEPVAPTTPAPVAEEAAPKPPPEAPEERRGDHATARTTPRGKPARAEAASAPAPREPEVKAVPASRPATDDVNALLANLRSGQGGGAASGERTDKGGGESSEALPEQLTTGQIQSVLRKQQKSVEECIRRSGVAPGTTVTVNTRVEIEGSGRVTSASVSNAGAAEDCIRSVLTGLKFPRFKGANMAVPYPFRVSL